MDDQVITRVTRVLTAWSSNPGLVLIWKSVTNSAPPL